MWKTLLSAALTTCLTVSAPLADGEGLTDAEKTLIDQTLGQGVLGDPVEPPTLENATDWFPLKPGQWTYRLTSGDRSGSSSKVELDRLTKPDKSEAWRLNVGTEHVQFFNADDKGLFRVSGQNHKQGVMTRYNPAQPVVPAGLKPGGSLKRDIGVKVYDLSDPSDLEHTGSLAMTLDYIGAYRVTVPAGAFDAVLLRTAYDGKVGPAHVQDTQYVFFAKGVGIVASIEQENISALFLYHQNTKVGKVMIEKPTTP